MLSHYPARWSVALVAALTACAADPSLVREHPLPGAEAVSLLGDSLWAPTLDSAVRVARESMLTAADLAYRRDAESPDALIWVGRRLAYLGRYREAIEVYTRGIDRFPDDPRLYRHRGHRFITVRSLDEALSDLLTATRLTAGTPDEVEPDGLPNDRGIPTSTLHSNIWYHLGLVHYLRGDFERAASAYRECMLYATNPDMLVATSHWLYMALRRLGREQEANQVLVPIVADLDIIENQAYHRLLMLYKGATRAEALLDSVQTTDGLTSATVAYGIGTWYLYGGQPDRAVEVFRRIVVGPEWAAFGSLAAEAELARMDLTRAQR
ncbi:MAG: tetratricopeptide repeat protein [Gemmatimonadota bacterium]|nr:tetratricopeptide repeat protein [Gemmatimonadota bacterium]MDH3366982.1 tetratricopeptide repeat protein [Gemmatimonadota bacterium]MDH3476740.1 tetratricopeptide repeat protein [Gemmatimonadota bacterium]MDH3569935.1 tetratricopeptide repeat protein [Gemmatimonadota bacterium]MDH5551105.1 tetratricopeptide repeat protein [Gemmatimonadota bacterium]